MPPASPDGRGTSIAAWLVTLCMVASSWAQLCGDCDDDGSLGVLDALLAARAATALIQLDAPTFDRCNVTGALLPAPSASVDVLDALAIAQAALALPVTLQCTPPIRVRTDQLCDGVEGGRYRALLTAEGGSGVGVTWRVLSPPPGISIDPGSPSALVGVPLLAGSFPLTLVVSDAAGHQDSKVLALEVRPPGTLTIYPCSADTGHAGQPYSFELEALGGTGVGASWEIVGGALPPGLTHSPTTDCLAWGPFSSAATVDLVAAPDLIEISGVAASRRNPGVLWVHNDSGFGASLWAIDTSGAIRQEYTLATAAIDWEDIALGPGPDPALDYLLVGDVGDNGAVRGDTRVLRVEEPLVPAVRGPALPLLHEEFWFHYPGGPRDCETLLVDHDGAIVYLIEKSAGGTPGVYHFPGALDPSWDALNPVTLLQVMGVSGMPARLTAGDASRDARHIVLRGYATSVYELRRAPGTPFEDIFRQPICQIPFPAFLQFEAVAYGADGASLVSISEQIFIPDVPIYTALAIRPPAQTTIVQGTPTTPGAFGVEIELRDSSGARDRRLLEVVIR